MKKLPLLWLLLSVACSTDSTSEIPENPEPPRTPVELRSIAFDETEVRLDSNEAVVTLRVTPVDAEVVPTDFRLVDAASGETPDDFTLLPTGTTDPATGSYAMRLVSKCTDRHIRRTFCAVYGTTELQTGELLVRSAAYTPIVYITTEGPVLDKENWVAGTIRIDGGNRFDDLETTPLSIRGRGNSTWNWEKKPYALKFGKKTSVLGFPKHKRWCLIANYMDRTHLRNRIAYHLGANSQLDYTVRNEFVEYYFNDVYQGCYLLTEQIKVDENRVNVSKTDGFLLEFDTYFDEEVRFRTAASNIPVNVKAPDAEDITQTQLAALQEYLNRADAAVQALRSGTPGAAPFDYLDRTSMIDFWIIFELMANHEMLHPKSVYFHRDGAGKLIAGPVWDFDFETLPDHRRTGWICYGAENNPAVSWMQWAGHNWWNVLLQYDASFRADAKRRWQEWKPFLETVPAFIRSEQASIASAVVRDNMRWPEIHAGNENGDLQLSFGQAVDRLESVYRERLAWLDGEISKW